MARIPSNAPSASLKATMPRGLAIQSKFTLPADVSKSDAETYAKLSKLSGSEFDKAYANETVEAHEKDVAEFQKEAISRKYPSLQGLRPRCCQRCNRIWSKRGKCTGRFGLPRKN